MTQANKPATTEETLELEEVDTSASEPWRVILYNDEDHTFEEVIAQLIKAIQCTKEKASRLTLEVHHQGSAVVYEGEFDKALRVKSILEEIDLITEIKG
ncbi:MAG: ATP-dependent Clp protease adaptor ClpS [Balneolaceae bacterium]|nr:ATP-dependent Clp protease adaptor ClpS [Balneolaceae bacterium]MDR9446410.1 ATP-dependent Clp protease adaptor ClpS [Balneolaceae bacterium]